MTASVLAACALLGSANAAIRESFTFNNWEPVQTALTDINNGSLRNYTFTTSGWNLGRIDYTGDVTEINGTTGDFGSESRILVKEPDGLYVVIQPTAVTGYTGTLAFSGHFHINDGYAAPFGSQPWEFRYINTFDDTPTGGVADCSMNITFNVTDEPIQPPSGAIDLGTIGNPGQDVTGTYAAGEVKWYKFAISEATGVHYLDINTELTTSLSSGDTELGLYNANGSLIATDDDGGTGFLSLLQFGVAAGHGTIDLPVGTYYLAVGAYNTNFNGGFDVTSGSTATGDIVVSFVTDLTGGGGGGNIVNPTGITVIEGESPDGALDAVFTSDDTYFTCFNDSLTLGCELEIAGTLNQAWTTLKFKFEGNVSRGGLIQQIKLRNYTTGQWVTLDGTVATTSDSSREITVTSAAYSNENGDLGARVKWYPVNDEAPAFDGWQHAIDLSVWQYN